MDHSHMDHGHGDHGDMGDMPAMCNMNMLFTWDTTDLCIVFRQWHIRGTASLIFSLLAIVAICAGYEALREATRRYESWLHAREDSAPRRSSSSSSSSGGISERARASKAVLYGVQNFYAFMIMLLFMTYNGFVMIAVAVGAGLGYYLFGAHTKATKETACH